MMGLNNMGGSAVGFTAELPEPTVERGASMAGMDHSGGARSDGAAPPTPDSATPAPEQMRVMHEMHSRMMADPVIRERTEADPALRELMGEMERMMAAGGSTGPAPTDAAMQLLARLLSDPEIEARVHTDPRLHELWNDPEVQRRLAESEPGTSSPAPAPHQH
jgi:hypothetical protein